MCGQARPWRREHRRPRGTALLRKSLARWRGWGAGKDGRAILTLVPHLTPSWPQETGYGLGGSDSAPRYQWQPRREELGPGASSPSLP